MTMKLRQWGLLVVIGLMFVVVAACSSDDANETSGETGTAGDTDTSGEDEGKVLNFINPENIPTMDSSLATDESSFVYLAATTEGLYRLDADTQVTPGIAEDHEESDDGLTWTFNLREDAEWQNGDPVTAHDFVYAWQRAVDPDTGSEYGPYMMNDVIKNAEAISKGDKPVEELGATAEDDYTLVVELENPTPYFETLTTFGTFFPLNEDFIEEKGEDYAMNADNLLANGPYKMNNWESTSDSWELVKNEDYWDADNVEMDKLTFEVVKDPQTAVDLYQSGVVDRIDLTSDLVDEFSTDEDYVATPDTFVHYIKMNQTNNEALANENVRKALSRAFDKEAMVNEVLNNGSFVANGIIPADFTPMPDTEEDFREVSGDHVLYDVDEAQEYWEKGLEELGTDSVEIELLTDDDETTKTMVEYLANQFSSNLPGLTIDLKKVPKEQRLDLDDSGDFEMQVTRWGPDFLDPFTFMNLFTTDSGNNHMDYSNPEYDKLVKETASELATDNPARYENFLEAEKVLFEDGAIAPLYQASRAQLISPKIEGVHVNPFGATYEYKWADVNEE